MAHMKFVLAAFALLFAAPLHAEDEEPYAKTATEEDQRVFRRILQGAETFSKKTGDVPHYKAMAVDPATKKNVQVGFIFVTTDIEPDEYAYAGPIKVLVGMTTGGDIGGIRVVRHREPYGSFSIAPPEFAQQFEDKKIVDPFEVGDDIDAVTRATISVDGAARVIRKSARKVMQQYLREQKNK
jgi:transcriptional regulator of nitric oxide reductase